MRVKLVKGENGDVVIKIPAEIMEKTELHGQEEAIVYEINGGLVVQHKNHVVPPTIAELFEGYEGNYDGEEWNTGLSVGEEYAGEEET